MYMFVYNMPPAVHLHLRMREIISRKIVQRSPLWPSRQRFASERQQGVLNMTGRFAELAANVKHPSSIMIRIFLW